MLVAAGGLTVTQSLQGKDDTMAKMPVAFDALSLLAL